MTIEELNAVTVSDEFDEFVRVCETRQRKALAAIADDIVARPGARLALLAGGSSAGKTTTATRLCTQIRVNDRRAVHFSTDDYFVGDSRNPRDADGELDYETVEAVDTARLASDLNALLAGERVHLRKFDFAEHEGFDDPKPTSIASDAIIVLEGIHALNPRLTADIADSCKYRVYIEPVPKIEVFGPTRLSPQMTRLLRRLVRDNNFRHASPLDTFARWPKVLAGEKKWIEPFRGEADATFDSSLAYELAVLKPYAGGLVARALQQDPSCILASALADILIPIMPAPPVSVPGDSILRETIGNSQLKY